MLKIVNEGESKMTPKANSQGSKVNLKVKTFLFAGAKAKFEGVYRHRGNLGFPLRYDSMTMDQRIMNVKTDNNKT